MNHLRSMRHMLLITVLVGGLLAGLPFLATAQDSTPSAGGSYTYPAALHAGSCAQLTEQPSYQLSDVSPQLSTDIRGTALGPAVLNGGGSLDARFDDLAGKGGQSFAVALHKSAEEYTSIVACGDIAGPVKDDRMVVAVRPVGGSNLVGVAILDKDGDKTIVTVWMVPNATGEAAKVSSSSTPQGSAASPEATSTASTGGAAPVNQSLEMVDIAFKPAELTIPANTNVTITLNNTGAGAHNFSIDELGINVTVDPGKTEQATINAPAGDYAFYCNVPGYKEAGMVGTLHVK